MAVILAVGGLDSSCGAGVLRDAQTIQGLGHLARAAVTAVTAQTGAGLVGLHPIPSKVLAQQMVPSDAVKIGMLCDAERVNTVARVLRQTTCPVVLDPVLAASSGGVLLSEEGIDTMLNDLLPSVNIVTPNLPELARLSGLNSANPLDQAAQLLARGAGAVLIKGGHATGPTSTDVLVTERGVTALEGPRFAGNRRGTGCTLASAIAVGLATGVPLEVACRQAKQVVSALFEQKNTL